MMTNLRCVRWMAFALSIAVTACSNAPATVSGDERLHFQASPAHYAALGLTDTIVPREDGRRTVPGPENFEWWYLDGLLDDGTVIVVWFGDNWFYGSHKRAVNIELTVPGQPTRRVRRTFDEPGSFSTSGADVKIGPHTFKGDLDTYHIHVDANETGGLGGDLVLRRTAPSYRPATGYMSAGKHYFAWLAAVPEGKLTGTITVDKVTRQVTGSGYHDHNWGNVSPAALFDGWWWGRAQTGRHTVIASVLQAKPALGGHRLPILYIADDRKIEVAAIGNDVTAVEGLAVPHPDPAHARTIGSSVSFETQSGSRARFNISDRMLTSADLLANQGFLKRAAARAMGLKPWYTRFESPVTTQLPGQPASSGPGTLEYFELQ
ncbi:MAG: hypothetical protein JWQ07_4247 [Ramlibacter sp.]|nr:hypothetical protein [Ramlibacter sp.]